MKITRSAIGVAMRCITLILLMTITMLLFKVNDKKPHGKSPKDNRNIIKCTAKPNTKPNTTINTKSNNGNTHKKVFHTRSYTSIAQLPETPIKNPEEILDIIEEMPETEDKITMPDNITVKYSDIKSFGFNACLLDELMNTYIVDIIRPNCHSGVFVMDLNITQMLYSVVNDTEGRYNPLFAHRSTKEEKVKCWKDILGRFNALTDDTTEKFYDEKTFKRWLASFKTVVFLRHEGILNNVSGNHFTVFTVDFGKHVTKATFYDFSDFIIGRKEIGNSIVLQDKKLLKLLSIPQTINMVDSEDFNQEWSDNNCGPLCIFICRSICLNRPIAVVDLNKFRAIMLHEFIKQKMIYKDII